MRLFLTSYQKAGTHQIMPALLISEDIVDRSGNDMTTIPRRYGTRREVYSEGVKTTVAELQNFGGKIFGHVSYLPEYYEALMSKPTIILVNVRDPRDIVVSNYYNIRRLHFGKHRGHGHLNFYDHVAGKNLMDTDDPISALIEIEAARWPHWWGWLNLDPENVMVVKYRELRQFPNETVAKIKEFLDPYELDLAPTVKRLAPKTYRATVRRCIVGEHKELFKPHHMELANRLFSETLDRLGYEK